MDVTCHHCHSTIQPRKVREYSVVAAVVAVAIILAGLFLCWPILLAAWLPLFMYRVHHACPACGLRLY
jgi:hypothetical protein